MAKKAPKTASQIEISGGIALTAICDALGIPKNYQKVKGMLKRGAIPFDIIDELVMQDKNVLDYFRLTYDEVFYPVMSGVVRRRVDRKGTGGKRKPVIPPSSQPAPTPAPASAKTPAKIPLPNASAVAETQAAPASSDGQTSAATSATSAQDQPKKKKEKTQKRDGIVKRVGKGALGVLAEAALSTMVNTRDAGLGTMMLSKVQERLDRNKMNNPVGATRKNQPTGIEPKHILAPLGKILEQMNENQTLILKAIKEKPASVAPVVKPIIQMPQPKVEKSKTTEQADEEADYRKALLERIISIDDNVTKLVKGADQKKTDDKGGGFWNLLKGFGKKFGGWILDLGKGLFRLIGRFPKLSALLGVLGGALVTAKDWVVNAGKTLWDGMKSITNSILEMGGKFVDKFKSFFGFGDDAAKAAGKEAAEQAGKKAATEGAEAVAKKAGTEVAETAAKEGGEAIAKTVAKEGAEVAGKSMLKKLPIIGLGAGLMFGAQEAWAGNWGRAAAEVASGAASMVPGVGTAASLAIDAGLAADSIYSATKGSDVKPAASVTTEMAGKVQSLDASNMDARDRAASAPVNVIAPTTVNNTSSNSTVMPASGGTADRRGFKDWK